MLTIDNTPILIVRPPEDAHQPPLLSCLFLDRSGNEVARVTDNEWQGVASTFDIETRGNRFAIRSAHHKVDLILEVEDPNRIRIKQMSLRLGQTEVSGTDDTGFTISTGSGTLRIPSDARIIERAPLGINVANGAIQFGQDDAVTFVDVQGKSSKIPSVMEVIDADVAFVDPSDEGIEPPPGFQPGNKITKVTTSSKGGGLGFTIPLQPTSPGGVTMPIRKAPSVRRNQPCPCGSGKKHKRCCGK